MNELFPIYVRTLTGLEASLAEELSLLGAHELQQKNRVVICKGDRTLLYKANLWCRTAIRVLRLLSTFPAQDEQAFYDGIRKIDWSQWLSLSGENGGTLAVNAHVHSSFTTHSLFLSQLTKDAVVDQFRDKTGRRPSVDLKDPDLRIVISLYKNTVQIYVDSSAESLHKRGYRLDAGEAPLNEALAAGILELAEWNGATPLIDPMCGSGTFLIEAGLMVRNIAPGLFRKQFGFQRWPDFDSGLYRKLVNEAKQSIDESASATILGIDCDPNAIRIAEVNIQRAGLSRLIRVEPGDFFDWTPPKDPGTIVMNPPYGERLSLANLSEFWSNIGNRLIQTYSGWTANVLCGNPDAVRQVGIRSSKSIPLYNGAIECRLLKYDLSTEKKRLSRPKLVESAVWTQKVETFRNRMQKNLKHYSKWAKREGISCWRVYDRDIPELPFIVELYGDQLHFSEVPRNYDHSEQEHERYMQLMVQAAASAIGTDLGKIHFSKRTHEAQVEGERTKVNESGHHFLVRLSDPLNVGLFLEQRDLRKFVEKNSRGKDFLNLFAYTGALTVYAAAGGAKSTTTVDTSSTFLEWAEENLRINDFSDAHHHFVRAEVIDFLENTTDKFDFCVVDPPARQVEGDHLKLIRLIVDHMRSSGSILFTSNLRSIQMDPQKLSNERGLKLTEVTRKTTPVDFERSASRRTWLIELGLSN